MATGPFLSRKAVKMLCVQIRQMKEKVSSMNVHWVSGEQVSAQSALAAEPLLLLQEPGICCKIPKK